MIQPFYIGQEVVALRTADDRRFIKDQKYVVKEIVNN
jgi:hypothetical protein